MADTFATYLSTGTTRGVAFVLVIEGCKYVFASDSACEQVLADGRTIVRGLLPENLSISESAWIPGAELDVSLSSIQITETAGPYRDAASRAFTSFVGQLALTWLDAAVGVADFTITVRSTAGITQDTLIHVGTEVWYVSSVTNATTLVLTSSGGVRTSFWGTTAQAFAIVSGTTAGLSLDLVPIYSEPSTYAGRRCWLYGRGLDDIASASATAGTLLFRGVVAADPTLDGLTWSLSLQPRTSLLDAKIGRESDAETRLRGVYYPDEAPLYTAIQVHTNASSTSAYVRSDNVWYSGFSETQESFCESYQAALEAWRVGAGIGGYFSVRPVDDMLPDGSGPRQGWEMYYTAPSVGIVWFWITQGGSSVDGWWRPEWTPEIHLSGTAYGLPTAFVANTTYRAVWAESDVFGAASLPLEDLRRAPRACYDPRFGARPTLTYPIARLYLDRTAGYVASASLVLTPPHIGTGSAPDPIEIRVANYGVEGYVQAASTFAMPVFSAGGGTQPSIALSIRFGSSLGANLAEFMTAVLAESPLSCNQGLTPWLTSDDVADWTVEVTRAAAGKPWLENRDYVFSKPQKLIDVLKHECRIYGLFMLLDANGKIAVKRILPDVDTPSTSIAETRHMPDGDSFGSLDISPDGIIGEILYKTDYNVSEDKHEREFVFRARGTLAQAKGKATVLEIAPVVRPSAGDIDPIDVLEHVQTVLGFYGARRYVYEIPVSMHAHSLRIGDGALLTIPQLPYLGARGSTTSGTGLYLRRGMVIGRSWSYGEEPRGSLKFLVHGLNIVGYAPTCLVTSATGAGRSWALTMSASQYGPGGAVADASFFAAAMKVRLRQWDKEQPQILTGSVDSVVGSVITVTLDADWVGVGASSWTLGFGNAAAGITAGQKAYCYIASDTGRVSYDSGGRIADNLG